MKRVNIIKYIIAFLPLFFSCRGANSQNSTIYFSYDKNGNRTGRILEAQQLKSAKIDFPVEDENSLEPVKEEQEELIKAETTIKIYPNPTRGILKVEIFNVPDNAEGELMLFDMSGMKLIDQNNLSPSFDLDISRFKDGLYILRVVINNKVTNWKIIKSS